MAARSAPAALALSGRSGEALRSAAASTCATAPTATAIRAADGYVFSGEQIGKVTPIDEVGTDRGRLDSYTEKLRDLQLATFFKDDPVYDFTHFKKTNGYANQPLDGLWLRAPYLHNGSVPTLRDLLNPPEDRPVAFVRGDDTLDPVNGGFHAPTCDPEVYLRAVSSASTRGRRTAGRTAATATSATSTAPTFRPTRRKRCSNI